MLIEVLRWADPPSKEVYQISKRIRSFKIILNRKSPNGLIHESLVVAVALSSAAAAAVAIAVVV
jgi:hypothetical protein